MHVTIKLRQLLGAATLAVCVFGLPKGLDMPIAPTVGGTAHAYAPPCLTEQMAVDAAWDAHLAATTYKEASYTLDMYYIAVSDLFNCMYG